MRPIPTLAIIQARMKSTRLPGKVLLDIAGQPMLARVVERARKVRSVDGVAVATTSDHSDDDIAAFCAERGYACYRGSQQDVLDRVYQAARTYQAQTIVRLTGDCPLIDPEVIDLTVRVFFEGMTAMARGPLPDSQESKILGRGPMIRWDLVLNRLPPPWKRTYPIGLDTEVCSFQALERAWREADQPYQREHVMPYLYEASNVADSRRMLEPGYLESLGDGGRFWVLLVNHEPDYGAMRWTVDTSEDLDLVRRIYVHFNGRADFSWLEVLDLIARQPELSQLNAKVDARDYRESEGAS